jgi:hypothetical protein
MRRSIDILRVQRKEMVYEKKYRQGIQIQEMVKKGRAR